MDPSTLLRTQIKLDSKTNMMALVPLTSKRNAPSPSPVPCGCPSSTVRSPSAAHGKRRKLNVERRAEVANMRKIGACMPCRLRKVACSPEKWPCDACIRYRHSGRPQSPTTKWTQCVPFSLRDKRLNVFEIGYPYNVDAYDERTLLETYSQTMMTAFEESIEWDIHTLCDELTLWMFDDDAQPASTSLVGVLSSFAFERLISTSTDLISTNICSHLRLLVEFSAALYCMDGQTSYAGIRSPDLWGIHAYIGTKVLQALDTALSAVIFQQVSLENLKGLFLVTLATIIAVGYSRASCCPVDLSAFNYPQPQEYVDAQRKLLCVLAHHLLLIGKRAKLLEPSSSAARVIEDASLQWKRRATFEWKEMPSSNFGAVSGAYNTCVALDATSQCRYHLSHSHTVTESCRSVGGFGTCIKDVTVEYHICAPSPMDQLLAGIERISLEPSFHACTSVTSGFGSSISSGCASCANSSSETTISTPQWTFEVNAQSFLCYCCHNLWPFDDMSINQTNICHSCESLPLSEDLPIEGTIDLPSMPEKIGVMAASDADSMCSSTTVRDDNEPPDVDDLSKFIRADEIHFSDPTMRRLADATNGLRPVNLLV